MMNYDLSWRDLLGLVPKTVLSGLQSVVFIFVVWYLFDNICLLLLLRLDHRRPLSRLYLLNLRNCIIPVLIEGSYRILKLLNIFLRMHTLFKLLQAHLIFVDLKVGIVVDELLLEFLL